MDYISLLHSQIQPIALSIANGSAFFLGVAVVVFALMGERWARNWWGLAIMRIVGFVGVLLVLSSSTPFPIWIYGCWCSLWLATLFFPIGVKRICAPAFLLFSAFLCLLELPHHFCPAIPVSRDQQVYVVGDSISAGIDTPERNWPLVLGDLSHLEVTNLSEAGATTAMALPQTEKITKPGSLVIVEIGGNDMFESVSSDQFSRDLDELLGKIPSSCHCAMFELPLIPFHSGYGEVQRVLAKKHHVVLIPKKYLLGIIGADGDTLDGLHLSQKGHNALARLLFGMFAVEH